MKRQSLLVALLVISLALVACSPSAPPSDGGQPAPPRTARLIIGTGGVAGSYYPLGGAMARVWTSNIENVQVSAQSTGGSLENIRLLERGEIELCLIQNDIADYGFKGIHMFDRNFVKLQAVATLFPEEVQIFVPKGSDIKSVADMRGKRVSVGSQGSGGLVNSENLLDVWGMTMNDIRPLYLTNVDAVDRMKDGLLDAIIVTTGAPNAAFQDLAISKDIEVLPFSEADLDKIIAKYPFMQRGLLPAGSYRGQAQDLYLPVVQALVVASADLSEDIVYELTKALWEHRETLGEMMVRAKHMDPNDPLKGVTIPIHPGAERYYREVGKIK